MAHIRFLAAICCSVMFTTNLLAVPGQVDPPPQKKWTLRWESVNANASSQLISGETERSVQVNGRLHLHDASGVMGINHRAIVTLLEGPDGQPLPLAETANQFRHFNNSSFRMQMRMFRNHPNRPDPAIDVSARLPIDHAVPESFKRVAGYVEVLSASESRQKELPLAVGDWVTLGGQLSVRIIQADVKPKSVYFKMKVKAEAANQVFANNLGNKEPEKGPFPQIAHVVLIDDAGKPSEPLDLSGGFNGPAEGAALGEGEVSLGFSFSGERNYKTLRIELNESLEVEKIPFELRDVRVPAVRP